MAKKFDDYHFDVIHTQTQFWMGTLGYMVARRQHIPHISTIHTVFPELLSAYPLAVISGIIAVSIGYPIAYKTAPVLPFGDTLLESLRTTNRELLHRQSWKLMNVFMDHTSRCIAPSQHIAEALLAHGLKVPPVVLPNGIDANFYRHSSHPQSLTKRRGDLWIMGVGRLSAEKRPAVLVEALAELANPRAKLVLVGDGPEREDLAALAAKRGVGDRVLFTGNQPRAEVAALLQAADVFTIASYHFDNQPMVILEALASGLPIVYADERLVEGLTPSNAIRTASPDPTAFAQALGALMADPARLKSLGQASLALAPQFDIHSQAAKLEAVYLAAAPVR
jgi:glycosyltransferase involved in cell wall biosynthesis